MATDFVDDDLLRPVSTPAPTPRAPETSPYERTKHRVEEEDSRASDELDRIRKRSEEIERQRQILRTLKGKQAEFDRSSHDLRERLKRHVVLLKDEEEQASRAATVCHEIRHRFNSLQDELDRIDPDSWSDATHESDITQALAQIEAARAVFRKGVDRVTAIGWNPDRGRGGIAPSDEAILSGHMDPHRFLDWLKIGVALTLPLALALALLLALYLYAVHPGSLPPAHLVP